MNLSGQVAASLTMALLVGCSGMPLGSSGLYDTSRTGRVHDIKIAADQVTPKKITAQPGDEIRWVNHRNAPVSITFTDPLDQKLNCERHFAQMTGLGHATKIAPNEYASLCFASPGILTYMARMEANVPGNEIIDAGSIEIVSGQGESVSGDKNAEISKR
jgi:plastocyanin